MSINTAWFKDKLAERQMSQRGLAKLMGIDSAAVSLMLRGKREMRIHEAAEIASLLGVQADEVLANVGIQTRAKNESVPVVGTIDGSARVTWAGPDTLGTVPRPVSDLPMTVRAIQCRTAGTPLGYMDRWVMLYVEQTDTVSPECVERLSVLKVRNGPAGIGQVSRGYRQGMWDVSGPFGDMRGVDLEYATPVLLIVT